PGGGRSGGFGPVVRDHRTPPIIRDHRTPPVVRDHRMPVPPVVRDHRTPTPPPVVRDHRTPPVVRDHRMPTPPLPPDHPPPPPAPARRAPPARGAGPPDAYPAPGRCPSGKPHLSGGSRARDDRRGTVIQRTSDPRQPGRGPTCAASWSAAAGSGFAEVGLV